MKTQLIEDFGESGSAPADPGRNRPVEQSHAAVPQAEQTFAPIAESAPLEQPLLAGAVESDNGTDWLAELMAIEAELQSTPMQSTTPKPANAFPVPEAANTRRNMPAVEPELHSIPAPEPELRMEPALAGHSPSSSAPLPELTLPPAREIAHGSRKQRNNFLKRRAAAWGTAAVLLGLLACGGLWLHGKSKVEGAIPVLATTKPVPAPSAPRSSAYAAPDVSVSARPDPSSGRKAKAGAVESRRLTAGAAEVPTPPPVRTTAVDNDARETRAPAEHASDSNWENLPQDGAYTSKHRPARMSARVRKHARAESSFDTLPDSESLPLERLDETLLHCRAHGYGKEECLDRGCAMTRFGFVCKG
jgi:hypothetical protein